MAGSNVGRFEGFYTGAENRAAVAALSAAAKRPGALFNPIYIFGGAGVGKSSLIGAYETRLEKGRRGIHVRRFSVCNSRAEEVVSQRAWLAADQRPGVRLLVIEDVDKIAERAALQREIRSLCDVAQRYGCQLMVSARVRPWALHGVDAALVSRFVAGLVLELRPPGLPVRRALLESFARRQQIPLSATAAQQLAEALPVTAEVLQRTLVLLDDAAQLEGCAITRELIDSFVAASASVRVSLEQVTAEVASHFGVSVRELRSGRRAQSVTVARRAAMYLARRLTAHSAEAIVRYFHKRHASTVSHACRTLTRQMEQDAQLRADLEALASALTGGAVSGWIGPS